MKRIVAVMFALALGFVLSGCACTNCAKYEATYQGYVNKCESLQQSAASSARAAEAAAMRAENAARRAEAAADRCEAMFKHHLKK